MRRNTGPFSIRIPAIGAPLTYVTTPRFLSVFGLGSFRDLPDIEALEDAGLLERAAPVEREADELDNVLGLTRGEETDATLTD
jgi:segregation and condensation protein B